MSDLPDLPKGWEWATLDELALSVRNGVFVSRPGRTPPGTRILRISAVRANALDSDDVRYADPEPERADDYVVEEGNLLFTRYSGNPAYVGACAAVGKLAERTLYPDKLIRIVINERVVSPQFVQYAVNAGFSRLEIEKRLKTTAGQVGIAGSQLRTVPIPVAPLAEQQQIVAAIEEHLSILDDGEAAVRWAHLRMKAYRRAVVDQVLSMVNGAKEESGHELFTYVTSGSRGWAKYYSSDGAAFVRVANVPRDAIKLDLSHVQMVDPPEGAESRRTKVQVGDLLITITADIGRVAVAPADLGEAYINQHVAIARPHVGVNSAYLASFVASTRGQAQLTGLQRGMTKAGLGLDDIRALRVPVPPLAVQERVAMALSGLDEFVGRTNHQLAQGTTRAHALRRSILSAAFSGELVPQNPDDEPASVLLERIRRQRSPIPYRRA